MSYMPNDILAVTRTRTVKRTWRERLLSWPWRPWVATRVENYTEHYRVREVTSSSEMRVEAASPAEKRVTPMPRTTVEITTPNGRYDDSHLRRMQDDTPAFYVADTGVPYTPAPTPDPEPYVSGQGGDFGGGGTTGSWSDTSSCSSDTSSSSSSDSGSCSGGSD